MKRTFISALAMALMLSVAPHANAVVNDEVANDKVTLSQTDDQIDSVTTDKKMGKRQKRMGKANLVPPPYREAVVYFTKDISPEGIIKIYKYINQNIKGKVAIKCHTGEKNGPNFIPATWVMKFRDQIPNSTIVETNTYYKGDRYTTADHRETLKVNGWDNVDILDENGITFQPIRRGKHFKAMALGKNITNYDSMVVLTHFKGHTMGGFGGSNKNIGIGCADGRIGKAMIHTGDNPTEWGLTKQQWDISKEPFMERMTESAKSVKDLFGKHIVFINVLRRMSVDCDCAGKSAAEPTTPDIGIFASTDILAVDKASVDAVYNLKDASKNLQERMESRAGLRQLSYMKELRMGTDNYKIVDIDKLTADNANN